MNPAIRVLLLPFGLVYLTVDGWLERRRMRREAQREFEQYLRDHPAPPYEPALERREERAQ